MMYLFLTIALLLQGGRSMDYQNAPNYNFGPRGTVRVGAPCLRDWHCIQKAFCRFQNTCSCETNYSPSADGSTCHAVTGTFCTNNRHCMTMSNAECSQGACRCQSNYFADIKNASNCIIRPTKPGDFCQRPDDCDTLLRATCEAGQCRCYPDHRYTNETRNCVETRGIYQPCTFNYQCYDSQKPDALYCQNGNCAYTPKYLDSAAASGSPGLSSTAAGIIALLTISLSRLNYF
ncbi:uncharacterized protein LOC107043214 [Diachasma alloeum]|uniref:uncharacterized protein LOC107043214 n=1 Tax=Diachasma alloeum TaxID=454923 RepID=UPI0007382429|nr:uncharacterized protein LOC107043214 [Diachasma alloeum]